MELNKDDRQLINDLIKYKLTFKSEGAIVELIIRPDCNQKCDYCYLKQHGLESYPLETRVSREQTIKNVKMIFEYFIEQNYFIRDLELFAGDMFYDNLFFEIIPYIADYYKYFKEKSPELFLMNIPGEDNTGREVHIVIPCNMSFCNSDEQIEKVSYWTEKIGRESGARLFFSYSTDGKYATSTREHYEVPDEFFEKVFDLCDKYHWGVHPMIGYENVDNAIKNYEWWKEEYRKHGINDLYPMFLEVRNDGWSDEKIDKYIEFLNYVIDDIYKNACDSNMAKFVDDAFRTSYFNTDIQQYDNVATEGYDIIKIVPKDFRSSEMSCGISFFDLAINCANFQFVPCHRLAYPMLSGGHFELDDNKEKIIGIEPNENINGYLNSISIDTYSKVGCIGCKWKSVCLKGCAGAQFEKFGDLFTPIPNICKLLIKKNTFLFKKYHELGLFHWLFTNEPKYPINDIYQERLLDLGYKEYEKYGKFN